MVVHRMYGRESMGARALGRFPGFEESGKRCPGWHRVYINRIHPLLIISQTVVRPHRRLEQAPCVIRPPGNGNLTREINLSDRTTVTKD